MRRLSEFEGIGEEESKSSLSWQNPPVESNERHIEKNKRPQSSFLNTSDVSWWGNNCPSIDSSICPFIIGPWAHKLIATQVRAVTTALILEWKCAGLFVLYLQCLSSLTSNDSPKETVSGCQWNPILYCLSANAFLIEKVMRGFHHEFRKGNNG